MADDPKEITDETIDTMVTMVRLSETMAQVLGIPVHQAVRAQLKGMQMLSRVDSKTDLFERILKAAAKSGKPS